VGSSNVRIAAVLGVSVKTVQTHRAHINKKLGVHGPAQLFALLLRLERQDEEGGQAQELTTDEPENERHGHVTVSFDCVDDAEIRRETERLGCTRAALLQAAWRIARATIRGMSRRDRTPSVAAL
jgi:hypothetical protein